jgi:hypothetical protein
LVFEVHIYNKVVYKGVINVDNLVITPYFVTMAVGGAVLVNR